MRRCPYGSDFSNLGPLDCCSGKHLDYWSNYVTLLLSCSSKVSCESQKIGKNPSCGYFSAGPRPLHYQRAILVSFSGEGDDVVRQIDVGESMIPRERFQLD